MEYTLSKIRCKGILVDLSTPKTMGILNITTNSFFDGGKYLTQTAALKQVEQMLLQGATFIDVGAASSRPGAKEITENEELQKLVPIIQLISKNFPEALISIDTYRSQVAEACINEGAALINDISAGNIDHQMFEVVKKHQVPYIIMHMQGTPATMQQNPQYQNVVTDVLFLLSEKVKKLRLIGLNDVIIDVGFGFGKTLEHNYLLLKNLEVFKVLNCPILVGLSRKSMIQKILDVTANEALNGTTALHMAALMHGANIIRTHDVKEAVETIKLYNFYQKA